MAHDDARLCSPPRRPIIEGGWTLVALVGAALGDQIVGQWRFIMRGYLMSISFAFAATAIVACRIGLSQDLFKIEVRGTMIDMLPDSVEVLVDNPHEAADQLVKKGGVRLKEVRPKAGGSFDLVEFRNVVHSFDKPGTWKRDGAGEGFKHADVVYKFYHDSIQQKEAFVKRYRLSRQGTVGTGEAGKKELYQASPGHFVIFFLKTTEFFCPMDPDQTSDRKGECPTCGMPFSKRSVYK